MRIISQNGKYDMPYENCLIIIEGCNILGKLPDIGQLLLATYSSAEKTEKAVLLLHKAYTGIMPGLIISDGCCFQEEDLKYIRNSADGACIATNGQANVEYHEIPRIFRFPADDEVEVEE